MVTIINSIIANKSEDVINNLLSQQDLLSPQEVSYLSFIRDSYNNSGQYPSTELIHNTFTELSFKDSLGNSIKPLSSQDLLVYTSNFLTKRTNLHHSQVLMKLATSVSQKGITDQDIESIRSLIPNSVNVQSTISSVQLFQDFYNDKKNKPQGIITNIKEIDNSIGGLPYGNMMVLFGYVASYKSMMANNIVYHNAMNLKYNICIISLEVPKEQVLANLITRHSALSVFDKYSFIPTDKINRSLLSPEEEDYVFNTILPDFYDYQNHGKIVILDETDFTSFSPAEIRQKLIEVDDECLRDTGYGLDAIDVDHINLCKFNGGNSRLSVNEEGNQYVAFFHSLAQKFRLQKDGTYSKLMCIILAQANRTGWKKAVKNKGRYDLTAISEFNELERSGQEIISVFTSDEMKMAKEASVQLLKNRFGPTVEDPQTVYAEPQAYTIGDELAGFADTIELEELEDVFGSGSIADLL